MVRTIRRSYFGVFVVSAAMALLCVLASVAIAAPANDNFANAQTITGQSVSVDGTTVGATREVGEPDHYITNPFDAPPDAYLWEGDHSVWYRWTAPVSGPTEVDTCTTNIDSILAVYRGDELAQLNRVADNNNDNCGGGWGSKVAFEATEGRTYQIAVSDAGGLREDTFTLNIRNEVGTSSGPTTRVSVSSSGMQANSFSGPGRSYISADGRYVAFFSNASNLVEDDTNNLNDIFVRDRQTGTTELISATGGSVSATISADGRYV